jgi:hypothetical protein
MQKHATTIVGYFSIATILTCCLFSCKKVSNESPEIDSKKQGAVYEYIKKLGYKDSEIKDHGDGYLVDGDILFNKNSHPDFSLFDGPQTEQYGTGNLVGYNEQPNIVLYIDPSLSAKLADIEAGVAIWNNVPNCRINISTTTSPVNHDITIVHEDLPVSVCGVGTFPMNGRAGSLIKVDTLAIGNDPEQLQMEIAHTIGHCLGFRHTNWISRNELQHSTDQFGAHVHAMHILGTPTGEDPFSLMNGHGCGNPNVKFSDYDLLATQFLYPENPPAPGTIPVFRYYNNTDFQDHFYTRIYNELGDGNNNGYKFEGIAFFAFPNRIANSVPVHRWYTPGTGNHFYSIAPNEIPPGSSYEGEAFFVYTAGIDGAIPIHRYYHGGHDDHFYTKNQNELLLASGYNYEIISWYAY